MSGTNERNKTMDLFEVLKDRGLVSSREEYEKLMSHHSVIAFRVPTLAVELYKRLDRAGKRAVRDALTSAIVSVTVGENITKNIIKEEPRPIIIVNVNFGEARKAEEEAEDEEASARVEQLKTMLSVWERLNTLDPQARKALREALEAEGTPREKLEKAAKIAQQLYKQGMIPKAVATNIVKKAVEAQKQE